MIAFLDEPPPGQDPDVWVTLWAAFAVFTGLALFSQHLLESLVRRARLKHPHPALIGVFRVWFGILAAGILFLIVRTALLGER